MLWYYLYLSVGTRSHVLKFDYISLHSSSERSSGISIVSMSLLIAQQSALTAHGARLSVCTLVTIYVTCFSKKFIVTPIHIENESQKMQDSKAVFGITANLTKQRFWCSRDGQWRIWLWSRLGLWRLIFQQQWHQGCRRSCGRRCNPVADPARMPAPAPDPAAT